MGLDILPFTGPLQGWMDQVISGPTPKGVESVTHGLLSLSGSGVGAISEVASRIDEFVDGWMLTSPLIDESMTNPLAKLRSLISILKRCPHISSEDVKMLVEMETFCLTNDVMTWIANSAISSDGTLASRLNQWTQYLSKMLVLHRHNVEELILLKQVVTPMSGVVEDISMLVTLSSSLDTQLVKSIKGLQDISMTIAKAQLSERVKPVKAVEVNEALNLQIRLSEEEVIAQRILTLREFDKLNQPDEIKEWIVRSSPLQVTEAFHFCAKVHDAGFWRLPFILRNSAPPLLQVLILSIDAKQIPILTKAFAQACNEDGVWAKAVYENLRSILSTTKNDVVALATQCQNFPVESVTPQLLDQIAECETTTALHQAFVSLLCRITQQGDEKWHEALNHMNTTLVSILKKCRSLSPKLQKRAFSPGDLDASVSSVFEKWGINTEYHFKNLGLLGQPDGDATLSEVATLALKTFGIATVSDLHNLKIINPGILQHYLSSQVSLPEASLEDKIVTVLVRESVKGKKGNIIDEAYAKGIAEFLATQFLKGPFKPERFTRELAGTRCPIILGPNGTAYLLTGRKINKGSFKKVNEVIRVQIDQHQRVVAKQMAELRIFLDQKFTLPMALEEDAFAGRFVSPHIIEESEIQFYYQSKKRNEPRVTMIVERRESDLEALLKGHIKKSLKEKINIILGVAKGLRAIHEAGYLHRDVKPANILIDGQNGILADLGFCTSAADPDQKLCGTPFYISPEVLDPSGNHQSSKQDMWAFGTLLYELFHPKHLMPPFLRNVRTMSVLLNTTSALPPVMKQSKLFKDWPIQTPTDGELQGLITALLCKDPNIRLSSSEVIPKLEKILKITL